jgi:hypothetical protein
VHEHELYAQGCEKVQVVREIVEPSVGDEIAAKRDDEDLAAERVDVRGDRLEPVDEAVLAGEALAPRRLRSIGARGFRVLLILAYGDRVLLLRRGLRGYYARLRVRKR